MRDEECNPEKILRTALKAARLVEGYEHICRRCKAAGKPESIHLERHSDDALRHCKTCEMKLWPRPLPRQMVFHDLRHTTATLLLRAGVSPHHVQRILRHASINTTTAIYGHLQTEDLREGLAAVFGREPEPEARAAEQVVVGQNEVVRDFGPPVVRNDADPKSKGLNPGCNPLDSGPFLRAGKGFESPQKRSENPRQDTLLPRIAPSQFSFSCAPRSVWFRPFPSDSTPEGHTGGT
jgi:hypothetical protein